MPKFLNCLLILLGIICSFAQCAKKTSTIIIYRDTTVVEYKDTAFDNQTYLDFLDVGTNTTSTIPVIAGELPLFDRSKYQGLDSILFVCSGYNYSQSGGNGSFVAELYDVTDNLVIGGSAITISSPAPTTAQYTPYYLSANILDSIPAKPIDLEILIASSSATNNAVSGNAFLLLSR
jgi:hypothetical protein